MKYIYLLALIAITTIACEKGSRGPGLEPPKSDPVPGSLKSSNFYYVDGSYYVKHYNYDGSGKLISDQDKTPESVLMSSREYAYNNDGQLSILSLRSATAKVAEHAYTYQAGVLVKSEYRENTGGTFTTIFEQVFEYSAGKISKVTVNHSNAVPSYYITYLWNGNNVTGQKRYGLPAGNLLEETVYEYDNKPNPYYKLGMPKDGNPRYSSVNNVTLNSTKLAATGITEQIIAEFEYNTSGLPVKQDNRFKDGRKLHEQSYFYH
ncbi:MAG TPA: hypothetical protein VKB19_15775 [Pedobacter sp.]|nr:hypothetical protein [Pedobacter sp.]